MSMNNITVGSDPEVWIIDNATGKPISADGLFPGTKEEPHKVMHGAVQVDGMAAEFNILPAKSSGEFVLHHLSVLRSLRDIIKENNPTLDFSFSFNPVAEFGAEYIASQPEHARRLGCTPDYNAWEDGAENPTPDADMPFRTASGHIHIGWGEDYDIADPEHIEACCMMSKQMDFYVGASLLKHEGTDGKKRRELYGKAGAFRPKGYGVEYRTSSNVWLRNTTHMGQIFNNTSRAFKDLMGGYRAYEDWRDVGDWVNTHNLIKARDYCYGLEDVRYCSAPITMENLDEQFFNWIDYDTTGNYEQLRLEQIEFNAARDLIAGVKKKNVKLANNWIVRNDDRVDAAAMGAILANLDDQPLVPAPAPLEWDMEVEGDDILDLDDEDQPDVEIDFEAEPGWVAGIR